MSRCPSSNAERVVPRPPYAPRRSGSPCRSWRSNASPPWAARCASWTSAGGPESWPCPSPGWDPTRPRRSPSSTPAPMRLPPSSAAPPRRALPSGSSASRATQTLSPTSYRTAPSTWSAATASSRSSTTPRPRSARPPRRWPPMVTSLCSSPDGWPPSSPAPSPESSSGPTPCSPSDDGRWGPSDPLPRRFDVHQLEHLASAAGLRVLHWHGIRLLSDLVPPHYVDTDAERAALLALEDALAEHPAYDFLGQLGSRPAPRRHPRLRSTRSAGPTRCSRRQFRPPPALVATHPMTPAPRCCT